MRGEADARARRNRITTAVLVAVALAFYASFILIRALAAG